MRVWNWDGFFSYFTNAYLLEGALVTIGLTIVTLILGLVWGVWHVPVYGPAGFVVPLVLAVFYTVLWNATHSVGLCILLHASFTPAQDHFILLPRQDAYTPTLDTPDWAILSIYVSAALVLTVLTRGRLGADSSTGTESLPSSGVERPR